jgi:hypothetical protein
MVNAALDNEKVNTRFLLVRNFTDSVATGRTEHRLRAVLQATRSIAEGEELYVSYGNWKYWERNGMPKVAVGDLVAKYSRLENGPAGVSSLPITRAEAASMLRGGTDMETSLKELVYTPDLHIGWHFLTCSIGDPGDLVGYRKISKNLRSQAMTNINDAWVGLPVALVFVSEYTTGRTHGKLTFVLDLTIGTCDHRTSVARTLREGNISVKHGGAWLYNRYCMGS